MPLPQPTVTRTAQHIRQVNFRSYIREDGLWDIEAEMMDTKAVDTPRVTDGSIRKAGDPVHHMLIRLTIDQQLVVHHIAADIAAFPVEGCPGALDAMQRMVGHSLARGWRKAIEAELQGVAGCTHMRELLANMATPAFQTVIAAFATGPDQPPAFLGRCKGWDFDGPAVQQLFPQFVGWHRRAESNAASTTTERPIATDKG